MSRISTARHLKVQNKNKYTIADIEAFFGKKMPHSQDLEEKIVGAILINSEAISIAKRILKANHFYNEILKTIYQTALNLHEKNAPIDLSTVAEELRRVGKLTKIGGAYMLAEITNKIGSSANLEYHARLVYQKYLNRDGITKVFNSMYKLYDDKTDIFDVRNQLADDLRTQVPNSLLRTSTMSEAIEEGKKMPEQKMLIGSLLYQYQACFMFGPPGTGKSILSVQIADAITKGEDLIKGQLKNECEPLKVLYIDFELTSRNIFKRYADHKFNDELFKRASVNDDFDDYERRLDKIAQEQIEHNIILEKPAVLIVDNITFLTAESSQDTNIAIQLMKKISQYKKKYDLTLLVIAHTSKKYSKFVPLEPGDMAGSAQLLNFCDAQWGIRGSALDPRIKYIKQFKTRDSETTYNDQNVIVMESTMTSDNYDHAFLHFAWMRNEPERLHLATIDNNESLEEQLELACEIMAKDPMKKGYTKIMGEIGWTASKNSLRTKMQKYATENSHKYMVEDGKVKYIGIKSFDFEKN